MTNENERGPLGFHGGMSRSDREVMTVQIVRVPGVCRDMSVPAGSTVNEVLNSAQIDYSGHTLTIDGQTAALDRPMAPGETLMAAKERIRGA